MQDAGGNVRNAFSPPPPAFSLPPGLPAPYGEDGYAPPAPVAAEPLEPVGTPPGSGVGTPPNPGVGY